MNIKNLLINLELKLIINLNKKKWGFLNQELPVVLNLFIIFLKYATFLGCFVFVFMGKIFFSNISPKTVFLLKYTF